eukprot:8624598-Alexandrium_andersonii.AAC.1
MAASPCGQGKTPPQRLTSPPPRAASKPVPSYGWAQARTESPWLPRHHGCFALWPREDPSAEAHWPPPGPPPNRCRPR